MLLNAANSPPSVHGCVNIFVYISIFSLCFLKCCVCFVWSYVEWKTMHIWWWIFESEHFSLCFNTRQQLAMECNAHAHLFFFSIEFTFRWFEWLVVASARIYGEWRWSVVHLGQVVVVCNVHIHGNSHIFEHYGKCPYGTTTNYTSHNFLLLNIATDEICLKKKTFIFQPDLFR